MMLMSACSAVEDTRPLSTDPCLDTSKGFQGSSTSHITMQKHRPAVHGQLPNLDYVNSYTSQVYTQQYAVPCVTKRDTFQRSCSVTSHTTTNETTGPAYGESNGVMFHSMGRPILQKSTSASSLRTRRPGQYKNDYASSLHVTHHNGLTCDGHLPERNNISTPNHYNTKVTPVQGSLSSADWTNRKYSTQWRRHSSYHDPVANISSSTIKQGLFKHHKQINGAVLSHHIPENVPAATPDSPNVSDIQLNTTTSIFYQSGALLGTANSGKDLSGNDIAKSSQKINILNVNGGFQASSANNGHSKAVRSSSFPLKLPPPASSNAANMRRQSVQSYDTALSRHIQNSRSIIVSSSPFCFVPISSVNIVIPNRSSSSSRQLLQRTISDDTRASELTQVFRNPPSCGEIESEYVTLDQHYQLPRHPRMNRETEGINITAAQTSKDITLSPHRNGSMVSVDVPHRFKINNNIIKPRPSSLSAKLLTSFKGMQTIDNDLCPNSPKNNLGWRNGTGTLNHDIRDSRIVSNGVDRSTSVSSSKITNTNYRNSGLLESSNMGVNTNTGVLKRCKSLPDLQDTRNRASELNNNYSDDEDGDDFGFLSYPISFSSSCPFAAMNKAKSPSPGTKIFPKRWRSKTKAVPAVSTSVAMWTPGPPGSCSWSSVSGRKVQLRPVSILNLSEPERLILQKIALSKLQSMDIGCPVSIPSENSDQRRTKKSLSLKRRSKSVTASSLDAMLKEGTASGLVFGIPLAKCLTNDRELNKRRSGCSAASAGSPSPMKMRANSSDNLQVPRSPRKSSSSSQGSFEIGCGKHDLFPSHKRATSIDSLPESESSRNTSSSLTDALSLPASNPASRLNSLALDGNQQANQSEAQVPYIVKACFRHIVTYGLQTLGIFRVGSSKKRVKQLREEFDSGRDVQLTEEHNPHDVGALLKEYFRDLPDPLLTRELYLPFLHAERIKDDSKKHLALSLLISMLPVANRDTLWALLQFLATVSQHATDATDEKGETVAGNKMDAHNLATLFGPNIIHRTKSEKSSDKEMMSESAERVGQSKEIIQVVKDMIDNHHELFQISGSLRDEILRMLVESNQEIADRILRHIANQNQIETDPESMCSVFEDSANSSVLYHSMNSDADLLAYAQRQTSASHRPLRITKSADDSLDSPVLKSRVAILSESQALAPESKDNHMVMPFNNISSVHRFNVSDSHSSPSLNRVPLLRIYPESTGPDSSRSNVGCPEYPSSEGFNNSLNIPRPLYLRESSSSSISSDLSSLNGHGWSENGFSGQWALPTPPTSRSASPKSLFQSTSSSSTLIASPGPSLINHSQVQDASYHYKPPVGSAEWERDRWEHWEKIAAQKKNIDTEQETLV